MLQSIEQEVRGLQQASKRLELATTEWAQASREYTAALNELTRKTILTEGRGEQGPNQELVAS